MGYHDDIKDLYGRSPEALKKQLEDNKELILYYIKTFDNKTVLMYGHNEEYIRSIMNEFGHTEVHEIGIANKRPGYYWVVDVITPMEMA